MQNDAIFGKVWTDYMLINSFVFVGCKGRVSCLSGRVETPPFEKFLLGTKAYKQNGAIFSKAVS